jgi:hypothetical protein
MDEWIELRRKICNQEALLRQLSRQTGIHRQTLRKISLALTMRIWIRFSILYCHFSLFLYPMDHMTLLPVLTLL